MSDPSSRHKDLPVYTLPAPDGSGSLELYQPRIVTVPPATRTHQVAAGDRLDLLAHRHLDDPLRYWRIADANPCRDPEELLEPGRRLDLPERD